ncbi:MAG: thiolase domain-containing protein [Thermodesulfobacteriota bacterium]|nr:thiolase domain-containing protein [Thermodesulfobacteriota bacterium]
MARRVAIVGVGMQKYEFHKTATVEDMIFDVARDSLERTKLSRDDIDAVVFGSAVDAFPGIHNSDKVSIGASGGLMKPTMRNSTSGSTAISTPILGYTHVASGMYDLVMVICYEKMSENSSVQAVFNTVYDETFVRPIGLNVPIQCSLEARAYLHKYGITERQMAKVSVKNRGNAFSNPYAQLPMKLTVEDVLNSPYMSWPVKLLDTSPVTDGARAIILASEDVARELTDDPVWIKGVGRGADSVWFMGRSNNDLGRLDYAYLAGDQAYEMAGIKNPMTEIDYAEVYDPFTYKEMQHCEALRLCPEGGAGRMIDDGVSLKDGPLPVNASGGLQGEGNPIGAGMSRLCWTYLQIKGEAGACQVPKDVNTAVSNGWGGMYQYSAAMVIGRD